MLDVCGQEGISNPPHSLVDDVIAYAQGNVRKALLSLEISLKSKRCLGRSFVIPHSPTQIEIADWEALIENIAQSMVQEQTPARFPHLLSPL